MEKLGILLTKEDQQTEDFFNDLFENNGLWL